MGALQSQEQREVNERKKEEKILDQEKKKREKLENKMYQEKNRIEAHWEDTANTQEKSVVWVTKTGQSKLRNLIIADTVEELPADVKESIKRMKVSEESIQNHFQTFLNILTFCDKVRPKRVFRTKETHKRKQDLDEIAKKDPLAAQNVHPPRMLKPEDEVLPYVNIKVARKMFNIGKCLGSGGFGKVFYAKVSKDAGLPPNVKQVALKITSHSTPKDRSMNLNEVCFMLHCDHPSICKLYKAIRVGDECWMAMEYMSGGNLMEAAQARYGDFDEPQIAYVARELLLGIQYLHKEQLAHRDLKNLNVMFTTNAEVKIIDFGLCCDLSQGPRRGQQVGSPFWMAAEMIMGGEYSYPVDIFSFSVCMLELANRKPPNTSNVKRAMFLTATEGMTDYGLKEPDKWSNDFKDFLSCAQSIDPNLRLTSTQLLEHRFLEKAAHKGVMIQKMKEIFITNLVGSNPGLAGLV